MVGKVKYDTGATRNGDVEEFGYDLISPYALEALSRIYKEGADSHGPDNWKLGMPEGVVLNHAIAHLVQYMKGDRTEDHLAKVAWGMFALIHYREAPDDRETCTR